MINFLLIKKIFLHKIQPSKLYIYFVRILLPHTFYSKANILIQFV